MKDHVRLSIAAFATLLFLASLSLGHGRPPAPVPYAKTEKIMKAKCVSCHQGGYPAGGVNLSSYAEVVKGKYKGKPLVVAKKPADSVLAKALHGTGVQKMPPGGSLLPAEIKTIEAWIVSGAAK